MLKLRKGIAELVKKVATSIPPDVEKAINGLKGNEEPGSLKLHIIGAMLDEAGQSRALKKPMCGKLGIPVFYIKAPVGLSHRLLQNTVRDAVMDSAKTLSAIPSLKNLSTGAELPVEAVRELPEVYIEETDESALTVDLILRCGSCDTLSTTFVLPDKELGLKADLDGFKASVLDGVKKAVSGVCPPFMVTAAAAATKERAVILSRRQLLRRVGTENPDEALRVLESTLKADIEKIPLKQSDDEISAASGTVKALALHVEMAPVLKTNVFVEVSVCCWVNRRGKLIW